MDINVKSRADFVRVLKEHGFSGPLTLEAAKAFCTDNGIEVADLQTIWGKTVTIAVTADGGEQVEVTDGTAQAQPAGNGGEMADKSASDLEMLNKRMADLEAKSASVAKGKANAAQWSKATNQTETKSSVWANLAEGKAYNRKAARGLAVYEDADKAALAGAWMRMAIAGPAEYGGKSRDNEICGKAMITTTNTLGGALVPDDFAAELISLKELRGAARQVCPPRQMARETLTLPRRTSGLTVYSPGEGSTGTASDMGLDNVTITAFKMMTLTQVSSELFNDSAINVADEISKEIAYAFADKEDECFFNGDATSTYYHVTGIRNKFNKIAVDNGSTIAAGNVAGLIVGTGNAYSELTLDDFRKVMGLLPAYADNYSPFWVMHKSFFFEVLLSRMQGGVTAGVGLGGVTLTEVNGKPRYELCGYPIVFSQVMPRTEANSQVCALLGAFQLGSKFGEVRGSMSIATSDQRYFDQDLIAIRGTQRVGFNVHDLGNYSATASSRVAGPIVGLVTAAS